MPLVPSGRLSLRRYPFFPDRSPERSPMPGAPLRRGRSCMKRSLCSWSRSRCLAYLKWALETLAASRLRWPWRWTCWILRAACVRSGLPGIPFWEAAFEDLSAAILETGAPPTAPPDERFSRLFVALAMAVFAGTAMASAAPAFARPTIPPRPGSWTLKAHSMTLKGVLYITHSISMAAMLVTALSEMKPRAPAPDPKIASGDLTAKVPIASCMDHSAGIAAQAKTPLNQEPASEERPGMSEAVSAKGPEM